MQWFIPIKHEKCESENTNHCKPSFGLLQDFTFKIQQYFGLILSHSHVRLEITNRQLCIVVDYAADDIT